MYVYVLRLRYDNEPEMIGMVAGSHDEADKTGKDWMAECERAAKYHGTNPEYSYRITKLLLNEPTF